MDEMKNIRIWVGAAEKSTDFSLLIQTCDDNGEPKGTIGTIKVGDPQINEKLSLIFQTFRMTKRL